MRVSPKIRRAILPLLCLAWSPAGHAGNSSEKLLMPGGWFSGCRVVADSLSEVRGMPPPRYAGQDETFCGPYTALALIQQRYCLDRPRAPGCSYQGDDLKNLFSILDVAQASSPGQIRPYQSLDTVIRAALAQGALATDRCASFGWRNEPSPGDRFSPLAHWLEDISAAKDNLSSLTGETSREQYACEQAEMIRRALPVTLNLAETAKILADPSIDPAHAPLKILLPDSCEKAPNRVPLPHWNALCFASRQKEDLERRIAGLIRRQRPVGASFCSAYTPGTRQCRLAHDTAITGVRSVCCEKPCRHPQLQYEVYDSLEAYWPWLEPGSQITGKSGVWIQADPLLQRILDYQGPFVNSHPDAVGLHWLE